MRNEQAIESVQEAYGSWVMFFAALMSNRQALRKIDEKHAQMGRDILEMALRVYLLGEADDAAAERKGKKLIDDAMVILRLRP